MKTFQKKTDVNTKKTWQGLFKKRRGVKGDLFMRNEGKKIVLITGASSGI